MQNGLTSLPEKCQAENLQMRLLSLLHWEFGANMLPFCQKFIDEQKQKGLGRALPF